MSRPVAALSVCVLFLAGCANRPELVDVPVNSPEAPANAGAWSARVEGPMLILGYRYAPGEWPISRFHPVVHDGELYIRASAQGTASLAGSVDYQEYRVDLRRVALAEEPPGVVYVWRGEGSGGYRGPLARKVYRVAIPVGR